MIKMNILHIIPTIIFWVSLFLNFVVIGAIVCVAKGKEDIVENIAKAVCAPFAFIRKHYRRFSYKSFRLFRWLSKRADPSEKPVWVGKEKEYLKRYAHD